MEILIDLIYAILLVSGGYYMIKFRRSVKSWTGNFLWAEKALGAGGTYTLLIMIGLFMIVLGVLYPFGGMDLIFPSAGSPGDIGNNL